MGKLLLIGFLFIALLCQPSIQAADAAAPAKPVKKAKAKTKAAASGSFRGELQAMDRTTMTITVLEKEKSRVIGITSQTRINKNGKPAALSDAVIGDKVSGQLKKGADGHEVATVVRFGAADAKSQKPATPSKKPKKAAEPAK